MGHISSSQKVVRQFGVSLIEVLLVLCVIGAGAAIAYIVGNKRIQASQADKAQLALTQISKSIEGVASTNLNYAMLSTAPTNAIPVSLIEADGHLKPSPWGAIALSTNSGAKAHESYSIAFSDVPPYGCVALASKGYDGFAIIEINGTAAWQSGGSAPDPAALSTACQQSVNVVKFTSPKLKGEWIASNPFIRTVYPPSGICLPPKFWNTITGTCDTPSTTCTPPQIWDAASSSCKTPLITCTPPQYLASTAAGVVCVGPGACVLPKVWDAATSSCITPPVTCTPPQVWDAASSACITPPVVCTPPQVWDAASGTCKTPPVVCTPPQVWDTASGTCKTPPVVCTPPQVWDTATSSCITPPVVCLPPKIFNPATGKCVTVTSVCPEGTYHAGRRYEGGIACCPHAMYWDGIACLYREGGTGGGGEEAGGAYCADGGGGNLDLIIMDGGGNTTNLGTGSCNPPTCSGTNCTMGGIPK